MKSQKTVLTFGTFDYTHPGHLFYLKEAAKYGNQLHTIIARDRTVLKTKNRKPDHTEQERLQSIQNLNIPNHTIILGHPDNPYFFLPKIKPDIIALGYDQIHFTDKLQKELQTIGLEHTQIIRIQSYYPEKYKSSIIRKQKS